MSAKTSLFLDSGPESTFAQPGLSGNNSRTGNRGPRTTTVASKAARPSSREASSRPDP